MSVNKYLSLTIWNFHCYKLSPEEISTIRKTKPLTKLLYFSVLCWWSAWCPLGNTGKQLPNSPHKVL